MSERKDGGPAYPHDVSTVVTDMYGREVNTGLSLRDYFAGQAMLMIPHMGNGDELQPHEIAHDAYRMADAMLAARGD